MKMPLGTEVGLGPGDIVFDEHPASRTKGTYHPSFRTMSIVAVWPQATGHWICHYGMAHGPNLDFTFFISLTYWVRCIHFRDPAGW